MNSRGPVVIGWVFAGVVLAACSGGSNSGTNGGAAGAGAEGGTALSGSCKSYTACSLITASDISQALSFNVGAGSETDISPTASSSSIESVLCSYGGSMGSAGVSLLCADFAAFSPSAFISVAGDAAASEMPVSGVGDAAYWAAPTPGSKFQIGTLDVFLGQGHMQLSITVSTDTTFTTDPLMAAEALARDAISRL